MQLNTAQKCVKRARPAKESNNSATVEQRITKFYTDIRADLVYSHVGSDVVSCFRSAFREVPPIALDRSFVTRRFACHTVGSLLDTTTSLVIAECA